MPVEIVEILRRSKQGVTRPFICRGDDGEEQTIPVDFDRHAVYELLKGYEKDDFWNWT